MTGWQRQHRARLLHESYPTISSHNDLTRVDDASHPARQPLSLADCRRDILTARGVSPAGLDLQTESSLTAVVPIM